jgi:adenine-specific DNA-methyltransferase
MDYSKYKIKELFDICKEKGIKGYHGLKKKEIIELLGEQKESTHFIYQPMITYIGNKRKLIPWIINIIEEISKEFNRSLTILDAFAGSGVVSRALMPFCNTLYANDMEYYSYIQLKCFLETPGIEKKERVLHHLSEMSARTPDRIGFISRLYSPEKTDSVKKGERCFYTRENAMIIDTMLQYIFNEVEEDIRHYCLAPLLIKASINVNTAGVFRGFYKKNGIGHFGGAGENALERILAPIQLATPVWSDSSCRGICLNEDANKFIQEFSGRFDIIYLDPPYNEHPYGSNYFMLNLIAKNEEPSDISTVSGIPVEWNKSAFNGRQSAFNAMKELIQNCLEKTKYILLSYNNEGLITADEWQEIFNSLGCTVKKYEKEYDTYHGSRNLNGRNKKVVEIMYLISLGNG